MKTKNIRLLVTLIATLLAIVIQLSSSEPRAFFAFTMLAMLEVLEFVVHIIRRKRIGGKYKKSMGWRSSVRNWSWISIALVLLMSGLIIFDDYIEEGQIVLILLALFTVVEFVKVIQPLRIYENGVFVYGLFLPKSELTIENQGDGSVRIVSKTGYCWTFNIEVEEKVGLDTE